MRDRSDDPSRQSERSYHGATSRSFPDGFPSPMGREDKCVFLEKFEILWPDISAQAMVNLHLRKYYSILHDLTYMTT